MGLLTLLHDFPPGIPSGSHREEKGKARESSLKMLVGGEEEWTL